MAAQVLLQRAVARLGVKSERREGVSGAGERVLRLLYSIVTKRGGRGVEIETAGAGTSIGISGESLFVIMTDILMLSISNQGRPGESEPVGTAPSLAVRSQAQVRVRMTEHQRPGRRGQLATSPRSGGRCWTECCAG